MLLQWEVGFKIKPQPITNSWLAPSQNSRYLPEINDVFSDVNVCFTPLAREGVNALKGIYLDLTRFRDQALNSGAEGGVDMMNKCASLRVLLLVLANVALMVSTVSADVVPRGTSSDSDASGGTRSDFTVALDLSGYRDAAVAFNFASLMSQNPDAFTLRSATGMSYLDGFRLLSPVRARPGRATPPPAGHFEYSDGGRSYAMAMFNLAAFDGQSVILNVSLDERTVARRRGMVNLDNLRISVAPASPAVAAASIPEPTTFTLCAAGLLGMFGAARWRRRDRLLFLPS